MTFLSTLLMMPSQGGEGGGASSFIMIGLIFIIFYFFMIRPQQKKEKELKAFRAEIKNGDSIITVGGIHGKVVESKESNVVIETEDGGKLRIERSCISKDLLVSK
jgi:preprotein translocase subunit YajC